MRFYGLWMFLALGAVLIACRDAEVQSSKPTSSVSSERPAVRLQPAAINNNPADRLTVSNPSIARLVAAAVAQYGQTVYYDPSYVKLSYPGGDVPKDRGVCSDVVIRALRGVGIDLQVVVHEDMSAHWSAYSKLWGLRRPDANIDHRRVANLMTYFKRSGDALRVSSAADSYRPGDLVAWRLGNGRLHIGVVTDRLAPSRNPLMAHNIGAGVQLEDVLFEWQIIGHYRVL